MKGSIETAAVIAAMVIAGTALQGCNTLRGVGTDIKKGGQAIEDSASNIQYRREMKPNTVSKWYAVNLNG